jgi:hypothetical protein
MNHCWELQSHNKTTQTKFVKEQEEWVFYCLKTRTHVEKEAAPTKLEVFKAAFQIFHLTSGPAVGAQAKKKIFVLLEFLLLTGYSVSPLIFTSDTRSLVDESVLWACQL